MYSKRQIEIAQEYGVVLKAIPVRDLLPFDKIFIDTQAMEEGHRSCKVFVPVSAFNCNCHKDVPRYNRRSKLVNTLVDDKGNKYLEDVFEAYTSRIRHIRYCSQLARYRYESDFNDDSIKYRPRKNHIQFVGQDQNLYTKTKTFESDETVFIVEDFGRTFPQSTTVTSADDILDIARQDEEIEDLDRYLDYTLGSWMRDCSRIHNHSASGTEENEVITVHIEAHFENLLDRIWSFQNSLKKINKISIENFDDKSDEVATEIRELKDGVRYILRNCHFKINDMGDMWDFMSSKMEYDSFLKCLDIISDMQKRAEEIKVKIRDEQITLDDYYWVLYADKLKRKYKEVV